MMIKMEGVKWGLIIVQISVIVFFRIVGCYGNKISYKHLPHSNTEIKVDKIIILDEDNDDKNGDKLETIEDNVRLFDLIEGLQQEINHLKTSRKKDRVRMNKLEQKMEGYHEEIIVTTAEVIQLRQLVKESFDKSTQLEDMAKDFNLIAQSYPYFEKEVRRDLRRNSDYKERAAKRFHQLEHGVKRLEKAREATQIKLENFTQGFKYLQYDIANMENITSELQANVSKSFESSLNCCNRSIFEDIGYNNSYVSTLFTSFEEHLKGDYFNPMNHASEIEITEFGSGEVRDYGIPASELGGVPYFGGSRTQYETNESSDQVVLGSGDASQVFEGSGQITQEEGSGDTKELPPISKPDQSSPFEKHFYVHKNVFQREITLRDNRISSLVEKFDNLTDYVDQIETRLSSIQLGSLVQKLQESFVNFSQNVLTVDQYQMTSSQIVNSTMINQDSIVKLTNMILDNTDKVADMRWKFSNAELLNDQQFNVLRMYIIRMNNTIEDIKEQIKKLGTKKPSMPGYQSGYYYGYGTRFPGNFVNQQGENTQGKNLNLELISSQLDHIGLQIVHNQNRIGNLEVKLLNESLYSCRKVNIDAYQDSMIASQEQMIRTNLDSILLNHELLKQLDDAVSTLEAGIRTNAKRVRSVSTSLNKFRGVVPAMVQLKREVNNFLFQLPTDCSGYYDRGYRKSGVYIIHPIRAQSSSQVTCHMDQDGGWTVIQQRFDGSLNFNLNWTDYTLGFGMANFEYWLGNHIIYQLTSKLNYSLMIEMTDIYDQIWIVSYAEFSISGSSDKYSLKVSGFSGNATDNMDYSNGMGFSTADRDSDASSTNCAYFYDSGWWYKHCQLGNLNGRYDIGFLWFNLDTNSYIQLKSSVMKIKPR